MCLYSQNIRPLISDKDLIVYKLLVNHGHGLKTPFTDVPVDLNSTLKASTRFPVLPLDYSMNKIAMGCIHARIDAVHEAVTDYYTVVKAIVKAGSPFYVSIDMMDIAANELYLTSEIVNDWSDTKLEAIQNETSDVIYNLLRKQNKIRVGSTLVRVGDVLLSDKKTYVPPEKVTKGMNVIGVVGFITDTPQIIALENIITAWSSKPIHCTAKCDKDNGRKNTDLLLQEYSDCINDIPVLKCCYLGSKNDWYIPSANEMRQIARNSYVINRTAETLMTLGIKASRIGSPPSYWTSTIYYFSKVVQVHSKYACTMPTDHVDHIDFLRLMLR